MKRPIQRFEFIAADEHCEQIQSPAPSTSSYEYQCASDSATVAEDSCSTIVPVDSNAIVSDTETVVQRSETPVCTRITIDKPRNRGINKTKPEVDDALMEVTNYFKTRQVDDSDSSFGKYVADVLKECSKKKKLILQKKILEVIEEVENMD